MRRFGVRIPTGSRKKPGCTCSRAFLCPPSLSSLKRRQGTQNARELRSSSRLHARAQNPAPGITSQSLPSPIQNTIFTLESGFFDVDGAIKTMSKRCHFAMSTSVVTIAASCVPPSRLLSSFSSCPCFHGMQQACRWTRIGARRGCWLGEDSRFWWGGSR